jgi:PhnB protein
MTVNPIPEGYHSITPYLKVRAVARLLDFLKEAFDATETERMARGDGTIGHAEVSIGDSMVMMGEPQGDAASMPGTLYLYVPNVDATYRRALAAGATSVAEPTTQFYGDRHAGITDPAGNCWWIATHVEDVAPAEMQRRAATAMR